MSQTALVVDRQMLARERVMEFLADAVETLDANALDDLLNRLGRTDIGELIGHLRVDYSNPTSVAVSESRRSSDKAGYPAKAALKTNGKILIVSANAIEWIQAERDYVRVYVQKKNYLI